MSGNSLQSIRVSAKVTAQTESESSSKLSDAELEWLVGGAGGDDITDTLAPTFIGVVSGLSGSLAVLASKLKGNGAGG
ncbi:MAG: hypothetical protein KME30_25400 [Iphinoe sp. HA4291-MV1]|jgi:hypothetical protein|nr:hypothetical protein [Iphinoe sp. HA4291-MV1]